jgi:hypothetical protein
MIWWHSAPFGLVLHKNKTFDTYLHQWNSKSFLWNFLENPFRTLDCMLRCTYVSFWSNYHNILKGGHVQPHALCHYNRIGGPGGSKCQDSRLFVGLALTWWRADYTPLGTPRGRYDEHSSKSSLSCETKVYRTNRRKPTFRRLMLASFATAPDNLYGSSSRALFCTSSNVEPTHNTTKYFAPTYDELINITGLL